MTVIQTHSSTWIYRDSTSNRFADESQNGADDADDTSPDQLPSIP